MSSGITSTKSVEYWNQLAERALVGELLSREDARAVLAAPDASLLDQLAAVYRVRRHFWENRVRLHFLVNAQSGLCPEDCGYCSQSSVSTAEIDKYPLLAKGRLLDAAARAVELRAATVCLVISGRSPGERVFGRILEAVREIKEHHDIRVCACLGFLNEEQAGRLKEAGVTQVNHNLNTSARHYEAICGTHDYEDRERTVRAVKTVGLKTCSGGIVGMGETDDDLIDMAFALRELGVRSVPINFLIPIPGTPLAEQRDLDPRRCLRALCLFRLLLPSQEIRIAGGREVHLRSMQVMGLYAANSIFIGDYLTTPGQAAMSDYEMIADAGFVLEGPDGAPIGAVGALEKR